MKRFKMGVINNLQTHKIYATNRKIIYQGPKSEEKKSLNPSKPPKPKPPKPKEPKEPKPKEKIIKPPSNPFANIPKPPPNPFANKDPFSHLRK